MTKMNFIQRCLTAAILSLPTSLVFAAPVGYKPITLINPNLPVTAFNLTFRVGSADDPKGSEGLAILTANLLREGGVKAWNTMPARTRAELEEFLFPLAADIEVTVNKEQISFQVTAPAEEAETVFNILSQMILAPAFNEKEFDRLKDEILDALTKQLPQEDQEELGKAAVDQQVFGKNHPYAHVTLGKVEGVKNLTLEKIQNFYKSQFVQKRLSVGIAGVISPKLALKAKTIFSALPMGTKSRADIADADRPKGLRMLIVKGPFEATGVHLGAPLRFNRSAGREFSLMYLAATAFGKHRSFVGRLMNVVREVRGLNYGTYSYIEDFPNGGHRLSEPYQAARQKQAFTVWARPTTLQNGCFLLRQVHREVTKLANEGLTKAEFDLAKSHLVGSVPLLATSLERRLGYEIDSHFYGIRGDYLKKLQSDIRGASLKDVNALLKKNIHPQDLEIIIVTPNPEEYKKHVLSEKCEIHYAAGVQKPAQVLEEDKKIATYSLGIKEENIQIIDAPDLFEK